MGKEHCQEGDRIDFLLDIIECDGMECLPRAIAIFYDGAKE
ncbi:MAG: hypothetical protein ACREPR_01460 [Brasilonema sp.]